MVRLTRGERFKDARTVHNQHKKQTMDEVAAATGISKSLIQALEDDDNNRSVGYDKVATLAAHYHISTDYLLGLSDDPSLSPAATDDLHLSEKAIKQMKYFTCTEQHAAELSALMEDRLFWSMLREIIAYQKASIAEGISDSIKLKYHTYEEDSCIDETLNEEKIEKRKRISLELPQEEHEEITKEEERDYDINSVLERARDKRTTDYEVDRHRKLNSTQYDILKNIKIKDDTEHEIDTTDKTDDLNTQEKTIVDLIQTISINSKNSKDDLLQDLISNNENTVVMAPINEDTNKETLKEELENMTQDLERIKQPLNDLTQDLILEKEKLKDLSMLTDKIDEEENEEENDSNTTTSQIEKSFFTNSTSFSKKDFEGFEDLEKDMKKSSAFTKIAIFLIILMLLGTIFIILNYVLDLKIL